MPQGLWAATQAADEVEPDRVEMDLAAGGAIYGEGRNSLKGWEARGRHARR